MRQNSQNVPSVSFFLALYWLSSGSMIVAQTPGPATDPLEFEVASVKPAAPGVRGMLIRPGPNGGVNISNMTLKELIVLAWRVQPFQISGGPAWLDSIHYDIIAKPESRPRQGDIPLMLQSLLRDRFQLTIHRETKELQIYALVLANKSGKLGPGLVESKEAGCTPPDPSKPRIPDPGKPPELACGQMFAQPSRFRGIAMPVERMIPVLSRFLDRTIVDKTGLAKNYDIDLQWTPDENQLRLLPSEVPKPLLGDPGGPSIFTALQEQLGLKLESQKGLVEMIVIDRAEKPSEN
jgi:uncharacterized protein (TIGR03435 family)